jgi:murein DD-endopeptidase MepM/ murein hydrolase activator NlpD
MLERNTVRRPRARPFLVASIAVVAAAVWWLKFDRGLADATLADGTPETVGRRAAWTVDVRAPGHPGLRLVEARLRCGEEVFPLASESFAADGFLGSGPGEHRLVVSADLGALRVPEGPATLEILAETYGWRLLSRETPVVARFAQRVDRTPPLVQILTTQHNMRVGGSNLVIFRTSPDAILAEVVVDSYRFASVASYFQDPELRFAIFAVPQDLTAAAQPKVRAVDAVGNEMEVSIPCAIRGREFRESTLDVSDDFLQRKIPALYAAQGEAPPDDLLQGYLHINRDLRRDSEARLRALERESRPQPLWTGAFSRMAAQTMSSFADRRSYRYKGEIIDKQTHLGVDLASLRGADVHASQHGFVVFAGDLGIYGQTVVIDHGAGVFSLYGHLRSILVQIGQELTAGETLGQTGETGLAGGDHLHFSIMVDGVHVDPIEWWDGNWIRDHITAKLAEYPRAGAAAAAVPATPPSGESDGKATP